MKMFRNSIKGFTLLEVLATLVIAGVLLATILFTFVAAGRNMVKNRNRILALNQAVSTIEFLRNYVTGDPGATKYREPWSGGTTYALQGAATGTPHTMPLTDPNYGAPNSPLVTKTPTATRTYTVTDVPSYGGAVLKRVTITVNP